jgi:hypothetical protein
MTMDSTYIDNQKNWWQRLLTCRKTLTFLEKEMLEALRTKQAFVGFYQENKDKLPEHIDSTQFPDMIKSRNDYLIREQELIRRSKIENTILENLAQEAIDNQYIEKL